MTAQSVFCLMLAVWLLISCVLMSGKRYRDQQIGISLGILGIGFLYLYIWAVSSAVPVLQP